MLERLKSLSSKQTGIKKYQTTFFLPTLLKKAKTCQTAFSQATSLYRTQRRQFGIKNANLATPGTTQECWCAAISKETSSYELTIFCVCVYLSVLFANYNITNEWPMS